MTFRTFLKEGQFVKNVDDNIVEAVMDFLTPMYNKNSKAERETMPIGRLREFVERYLNAAKKFGFGTGVKIYDPKNPKETEFKEGDEVSNTANYVVHIMNILGIPTSEEETGKEVMSKFEKKLENFVKGLGFKGKE